MAIYSLGSRKPKIAESAYIASEATIIGKVTVGELCFIAPGACLRGDLGEIIVGNRTNVQDNCIFHCNEETTLIIGDEVITGHAAILHNCIVENNVVIGMNSVISSDAIIRQGAVIGEGAVVPRGREIPGGKIALGVPAKIVGEVSEAQQQKFQEDVGQYVDLVRYYQTDLKEIEN